MIRNVIYLVILQFLLVACPNCPEPEHIDVGEIPEEILNLVPYQDGESYNFIHSEGQVILFSTQRNTEEEYFSCENYCCETIYEYDLNTTRLTPNYTLFPIKIIISTNNFQETPTAYYLNLKIGTGYVQIPQSTENNYNGTFVASININNIDYTNVYKLKASTYETATGIKIDSVYYNYQKGILKILMDNEEYYEIQE